MQFFSQRAIPSNFFFKCFIFYIFQGGKSGKNIEIKDSELIRLANDSTTVINSTLPLGEDCLQVCFVHMEDMDKSLETTSLIHAAQTTAGERVLLYKYLDVVGELCIYNDTG